MEKKKVTWTYPHCRHDRCC